MNCDRFAKESENRLLDRFVIAFIQSVYDNEIGAMRMGR